ncbi:MAG: hypothetical protein WCE75_07075, partial [Terracidiphilus sp.]
RRPLPGRRQRRSPGRRAAGRLILQRLRKNFEGMAKVADNHPAGAKAQLISLALSALLKSCSDTFFVPLSGFFRSL